MLSKQRRLHRRRLTDHAQADKHGIEIAGAKGAQLLGTVHHVATARIAGWSAHRLEELICGKKIIRPAYMSVAPAKKYIPLSDRTDDN